MKYERALALKLHASCESRDRLWLATLLIMMVTDDVPRSR